MILPTPTNFIASALLIATVATVQAQFLPVNGSGKCGVEEVVLAEGQSTVNLYENEKAWFQSVPGDGIKFLSLSKDSIQGRINGEVEALVYAQSGILRKVAGSVTYHISVEVKDGKYRYNFSSYIFHYYGQNRNYEMVKTGKTKPMEESKASGWQKLWTQHRKTMATITTNQIKSLKIKMAEVPQPANAKSESKKVEW